MPKKVCAGCQVLYGFTFSEWKGAAVRCKKCSETRRTIEKSKGQAEAKKVEDEAKIAKQRAIDEAEFAKKNAVDDAEHTRQMEIKHTEMELEKFKKKEDEKTKRAEIEAKMEVQKTQAAETTKQLNAKLEMVTKVTSDLAKSGSVDKERMNLILSEILTIIKGLSSNPSTPYTTKEEQ